MKSRRRVNSTVGRTSHMNLKRIVIGLGATVFIALAVVAFSVVSWGVLMSWAWTSGDIPHKSDEELIANFKTHEAEFDQLLQMVVADKGLLRVDDDWTNPTDPKTIGVSDERIATYRNIFRKLDIPRGFSSYQGGVEFISSSQGLAVGGSSKCYTWLEKPPPKLVDNIETYRSKPGASYPVFRHVQGNWYLVFYAE
jgi:hypothetical protein